MWVDNTWSVVINKPGCVRVININEKSVTL